MDCRRDAVHRFSMSLEHGIQVNRSDRSSVEFLQAKLKDSHAHLVMDSFDLPEEFSIHYEWRLSFDYCRFVSHRSRIFHNR